ncbi:MAG: lysine--tRNA ligase [Candidatus Yanofskybacteria bacterium RIFCSPHIGHO2_01_FULL_44_17]|uniref:Lysine--tRNA ligase n=1 Tax=Candidatus Yanofskybacteria bacterium RIFCSPHIGHO2_01_FULL_44_17 TaxID=1802668 RepID=A0A1F8EWD4_9BACT|nr:MAG: lysine--tRNA ligase [Candidatus Yanofskybacteria bacterium RIFCSPHIGHO2_01_FULL_44_17]
MSLEDIREARLEKLDKLKKAGIDPYQAKSLRTHGIAQVVADFDKLAEEKQSLVLAGRVMAKREQGGLAFVDIDDGSASLTRSGSGKIQLLFKKDDIGEKSFDMFSQTVDIGDFIEASGTLFKTKREEKTLAVTDYKILTKSLLPLPEKWHGLEDVEEKLRRRYLDLIMDPKVKELFIKKSVFWQATREFLLNEGGLEVETPILERIPGGADAEPFKTHMNALGIDLYLRIAPELNLKRLSVGGFEKVFEIGRIFRNEGIDREHLQDYTQMEMYWAYADYEELMKTVERLVKHVVHRTLGSYSHPYQGKTIDWYADWKKIDYFEVFKKYTGLSLAEVSEKDLKKYAENEKINIEKHMGRGRLIDVIFKKKVRAHLIEPGFLILPPVDIEPLAKRYSADPSRVERFQIVACGSELGKGFSELNDPIDQRERFEEQVKLGKAGDKEAQRMDEDFVEALEYGMPPTAGFAYSERLFAFIMNKPVRETAFFPLMKPRS